MRKVLGWLVGAFGFFASACWLVYVGTYTGPRFSAPLSEWASTIAVLSMGVLSLVASILALRRPRPASLLLLIMAASLLVVWSFNLPRKSGPWPGLRVSGETEVWGWFLLLVVPGIFWYVAAGLAWPPTLSAPLNWWKRIAGVLLTFIAVAASLTILDLRSPYYSGCHGQPPLFAKQVAAEQAVFIARILASGYVHPAPEGRRPGVRNKQWALAWVANEFWGLPWWDKKIAILTVEDNSGRVRFPLSEDYFVDGYRPVGALTRFLPIFYTTCTHTGRLESAEPELRVMREGAPQNGIRIIGRTLRRNSEKWEPVPGAQVIVEGPSGRTIVVSDQNGVYDTREIPLQRYYIYGGGSRYPQCGAELRSLKVGDIRGCTVLVE